jgi:DNA polymerase III gamma/tau subunit
LEAYGLQHNEYKSLMTVMYFLLSKIATYMDETHNKNILLKWQLVKESFFEDDALHIIAQKADGAMRDALSIF